MPAKGATANTTAKQGHLIGHIVIELEHSAYSEDASLYLAGSVPWYGWFTTLNLDHGLSQQGTRLEKQDVYGPRQT